MRFHVYVVEEKIETFYLAAIHEFAKRLDTYCQIQFTHLKNEALLRKALPEKSYIILVSTEGTMLASEELAQKVNHLRSSGIRDVSIVINAKHLRYDELLALSPMEMDVGLMATIVFEQMYRAFRIINNHPYHK